MDNEIIKATKNGDLQKVRDLLTADSSLVGALDKDGSTPLHLAAWKGYPEIVQILLEAGADVQARNNNDHWGDTAMHAAAHSNRTAIIQQLVAKGADINARDINGNTPLTHTTYHKANAAANLLKSLGAV